LKRPGFKNFEKWRVIYNGIADAADAADAADINDHKNKKNFQNKFKFPDNAIVLLMLATYEPRKGHEFILSALKQIIEKMPNVYLLICGDGSDNEFDKVKKYASILEISQNIRMEKFHSDVQWLIKSADILVVPSQSYESFGLVIIEAMAKGIPVVATNVGGIPEVIVDNESGFCVDSKNIYEFSSKILQLISDPVLYSYFSKQGRIRFATKFTAKRMALEYRNILFD
jgi:glycosyltransferase involved in cell wall biosynthesis